MIRQLADKIWQLYFSKFGSNVYLLKIEEKEPILVDTSSRENRTELVNDLEKIGLQPEDIKKILLTHLHTDHIGNLSIFSKAKIYASKVEIDTFTKSPLQVTLDNEALNEIKKVKLLPLSQLKLDYLLCIPTAGHTAGSVCFYLPKEKVLFSGDTLFEEGVGRTDLPTGSLVSLESSLKKLKKLKYKLLCPGH